MRGHVHGPNSPVARMKRGRSCSTRKNAIWWKIEAHVILCRRGLRSINNSREATRPQEYENGSCRRCDRKIVSLVKEGSWRAGGKECRTKRSRIMDPTKTPRTYGVRENPLGDLEVGPSLSFKHHRTPSSIHKHLQTHADNAALEKWRRMRPVPCYCGVMRCRIVYSGWLMGRRT